MVYYFINFNQLGDLEADYDDLIGREFRPKWKWLIKFQNISEILILRTTKEFYFPLTEEHNNMVGIIFNLRLRDVLSDLENQIGISLIPSKLTYIERVVELILLISRSYVE